MPKKIPKVLLLVDTSRESGRKLLYGITKYSRLNGPWTFNRKSIYFFGYQTRHNRSRQLEEEALSRLEKWGANGVIATNINDPKQFGRILAMDLPAIILGGYIPKKSVHGWHRVRSDSVEIGKVAAEHLLNRGFQKFAYCGYYDLCWSENRGAGFAKRIAEAGFETHFFKPSSSRIKRLWENEQAIMVDWLKSLPKPLGIMACNDDRGQNILEACKITGLNVPDEVAVIGVDNDILACEVSEPPLSSIPLNNERAGYEAAELLAKLMAGEKMTYQEIVTHPATVVTRQSTDNLAIEDSNIAKAVRFIRQHATEIIQVSDVVDVVPMSRRSLERSFRKTLGHSVFEEIKRVHVNQFTMMLTETNMSISQIASALGHPSVENINRYFRKEKGMSPTAYRKKFGPR
ncbi:MAG: AraC family transcriptional regulator [Planctomycetota bacterium]|jgi:LacI family transcriptional regulator